MSYSSRIADPATLADLISDHISSRLRAIRKQVKVVQFRGCSVPLPQHLVNKASNISSLQIEKIKKFMVRRPDREKFVKASQKKTKNNLDTYHPFLYDNRHFDEREKRRVGMWQSADREMTPFGVMYVENLDGQHSGNVVLFLHH
jgi:hypothetical protein